MIRKLIKVVLAAVILLAAAVGYTAWVSFGINAPAKDGEMAGRGRAVLDKHVQAYVLYAGGGQLVLIDAGRDPEAKALKAEIARRNLSPEAVKAIFLTHAHPDHVAGAAHFPNARVYAMASEIDYTTGRRKFSSPVQTLYPHGDSRVAVTHPLQDGDIIEIGELTVRAFHLPGHTAGSAAFLADGVLYLGDSARGLRDGTLGAAPWFFSDDTERNRQSLKALARRLQPEEVKTLAFAHSGPLSGIRPLSDFARSE